MGADRRRLSPHLSSSVFICGCRIGGCTFDRLAVLEHILLVDLVDLASFRPGSLDAWFTPAERALLRDVVALRVLGPLKLCRHLLKCDSGIHRRLLSELVECFASLRV